VFTLGHNPREASQSESIPYDRKDSYPDFPVLEAAAIAGCQACSVIRHAFQHSKTLKTSIESDYLLAGWDGAIIMKEFRAKFECRNLVEVSTNCLIGFSLWFEFKPGVMAFETIDLNVYADEGMSVICMCVTI
jgi:hypothetical protein